MMLVRQSLFLLTIYFFSSCVAIDHGDLSKQEQKSDNELGLKPIGSAFSAQWVSRSDGIEDITKVKNVITKLIKKQTLFF